MNLDELQSIQSRERQATSLQELRPTFYQDAGEFIRELVRERDRAAERADDPFSSPEVRRLTDDIETAKSTVEALYERRIGKVVKSASIAAAGMPADDDGLTEEEQQLFDTLVDRIERNRERVLDGVIDGDGSDISCARDAAPTELTDASESSSERTADSADRLSDAAPGVAADPSSEPTSDSGSDSNPAPGPDVETTVDSEPGAAADLGLDPSPPSDDGAGDDGAGDDGAGDVDGVSAAEMMGSGGTDDSTGEDEPPLPDADAGSAAPPSSDHAGATDSTDPEPTTDAVERTTVRITRDVGEVFGVDERSYELSSDDVVTLPAENAGPLVERDAAERLE
jgi:DNA replication factor GINS